MNHVILKGNIGNDPDVKSFSWGKVAKFSLATSETYKNKEGQTITNTDWHNIVFTGKIVDTIEKHVHKGDQLLIIGRIKYRSYEDKEGRTIYITDIIGDRFEFCGTKENKSEKPKEDDLPDYIQEQQEVSQIDDSPFE